MAVACTCMHRVQREMELWTSWPLPPLLGSSVQGGVLGREQREVPCGRLRAEHALCDPPAVVEQHGRASVGWDVCELREP